MKKLIILMIIIALLGITCSLCSADVRFMGDRFLNYADITQELTSTGSGGSFISAGGMGESAPLWQAFDNNPATTWSAYPNGTLPMWVKWNCGNGIQSSLIVYTITARDDGYYNSATYSSFTLYGSNDNLVWDTVDTRAGFTWTQNEKKTFTLTEQSGWYRYFKFDGTTGGDAASAAEFELFGYKKAVAVVNEDITYEGSFEGTEISCKDNYPGEYVVFAFDNVASTVWGSGSALSWIKWNCGTWRKGLLTGYSMTARNDIYANTATLATFKLYGSNDDSNWDELDSQTGLTWSAAEKKTFSVTTSTQYQYFKIEGSGSVYNPSIAEVELIGLINAS